LFLFLGATTFLERVPCECFSLIYVQACVAMLPNAECSATFRNFLLFKFFWWLIYAGLKFNFNFNFMPD